MIMIILHQSFLPPLSGAVVATRTARHAIGRGSVPARQTRHVRSRGRHISLAPYHKHGSLGNAPVVIGRLS